MSNAQDYTKALVNNQEMPYDSTFSVVKAIYNQLGGNGTDFESTYQIVLAILRGLESGSFGPGGGGSGSVVTISDLLPTGSLIGTLTIDEIPHSINIPDLSEYVTSQNFSSFSESVAQDFANLDIPDVSIYATTASVNSLSESVAQDFANNIHWEIGRGGSSLVRSGLGNDAYGDGAIALGSGSKAITTFALAAGKETEAGGEGSTAEGIHTIAKNPGEHAQGRYNVTESSQIFSIGIGDDDNSRRNAISVITGSGLTPSASVYIYGVGGYDGTVVSGSVNLADVLTGIANAAARKPVVLYETDGTTGLLGHNANTYEGNWQLEDYDFTPYKKLECYFKASAVTSSDAYTPSVVVTIPLDEAAKGPTIYTAGAMVALPFNRNREYLVGVAVDATKTKFQVVHQNTLWDISTSDANNNGRYMYKILGYLD